MVLLYAASSDPRRGEIPVRQTSNLSLSEFPQAAEPSKGVEDKYCFDLTAISNVITFADRVHSKNFC